MSLVSLTTCNFSVFESFRVPSLVICAHFHPLPLIKLMLKFVGPSRPFVVYHQHHEVLVDCFQYLRGITTNLAITSSFMRELQVLPQRTHPFNMTNPCSGYLLWGTTLAPLSELTLRHLSSDKGEAATKQATASDSDQQADVQEPVAKREKSS
eukprot:m.142647 g.142647  ORF g.142647 m.142647 type:complete len:153 (+) comp14065_c0_seq1:98-556(+)